jgi:outer membrane receptor protein involved in Fe transport
MSRLILLALALSASAFAQFDTATVLGTVKDPSGAVVAKSSVTLYNPANGTRQTVLADVNGEYQFLNVRLGEYSVEAEAPGFKVASTERFTVTVNARQRVDVVLQVGEASEKVEVTGTAAILETDSSNRGQVVASREILNLPLNGRSYADLTLLVPGARKSMLQDQSPTSRDASYNVNGQRSESNNFILDGVDNNAYGTSNQGFSNQVVQITPDAVAEYRVESNNFSAEYGRASGAVINATMKSGTNQIHGSLWEFMRNTQLNAVGFFKPTQGVKPTYIQNQFGASFGAPIVKDKLFFFGDYEGQRRVISSLTFATVPNATQKTGNVGAPVQNALTGDLYSNGIVPAAQMIPSSVNILNALPNPNLSGLSNNFQSLPKGTITDNKGDFRIDYYASQKLTAFTRYSHRVSDIYLPGNIPGPAGGNNNGNVHIFNQQVDPGLTYSLSPTSALEARLGIGWTEGGKTPLGLGLPSLMTGVPNMPTDKLVAGAMNSVSVSGFSQFGRQGSNPQFQNPFVVNPKLTYSKYMGRHTVKAGYEFVNVTTTIDDFNPAYGNFNYAGQFAKPTGGASGTLYTQAYNLTDFLVGAPSHYELNNLAVVDYRQFMHFAFAQDDWKVSSRLTLNLGLRYEFASPQWVADNRLANYDPASSSLIQAKSGDLYSRSLQHPQYNNWAPRVGFAWRPFDKTVVRSAYGLSYQQFNRLGGENLLAYNGPNIVDAQIDQIPSQGICGYNSAPQSCFRPTYLGYPENFASPSNFNPLRAQARYIPSNNPTGYVQSWHFTVQRQLAKDWVLDVAYVGNKGSHLMILADYNQATPNAVTATCNASTSSGCQSLQARRPIQNFAYIEVAYGAGFSSYNALQTKLEKRFSNGLYLLNSFTWSKAIDAASGHLETANGDNSRVNFANVSNEKGLSSYDQPLNDTLSLVWDLPYGTGRHFGSNAPAILRSVFGGWRFSAINTLTSGLPINLTYSPTSQFQVSTAPNYRPNISGNPVTPEGQRATTNYLNANTVSIPTDPSQPWGNAGRNIARGYPLYQLDIGLHKDFPLWSESRRLEFRSEAFNLMNQTNFQAPESNRTSSSFGSITSTFPARQLQFAMKLIF